MRVQAVPKTATKNPNGSATKIQLHVSHTCHIAPDLKYRVIDFSERKLQRILKSLFSAEKREQVARLLENYVAGRAAVGWSAGSPIFVDVNRDR